MTAVTGSALGVNSAAGAARNPGPLGTAGSQPAADSLVLTQGLVGGTGSSPSSTTDAPQVRTTRATGWSRISPRPGAGATGVLVAPDSETLAPGATTVTAPTVAPPPLPAPPTVPVPLPEVSLDVPCVPVAPLTTC